MVAATEVGLCCIRVITIALLQAVDLLLLLVEKSLVWLCEKVILFHDLVARWHRFSQVTLQEVAFKSSLVGLSDQVLLLLLLHLLHLLKVTHASKLLGSALLHRVWLQAVHVLLLRAISKHLVMLLVLLEMLC